jgi:hypothetical protein
MKLERIDPLPALLAVSSVLPYLLDLGYRIFELETLVISVTMALLGGTVAWKFGSKSAMRDIFVSLLVYWVLDGYFISSFAGVIGVWLAFLGGFAVLGLLQGKFASSINAMLVAFSAVWLFSNLLLSSKEMIEPPLRNLEGDLAGAGLPPIVHLILDEQMSPEALPDTIPATSHPATRIVPDYMRSGFDVFTSVWSSHHLTHHSLSETFSLTSDMNNFAPGAGPVQWRVSNNNYVSRLVEMGYQVNVVQSNYLDICPENKDVFCYTYSRSGNGRAFTRRVPNLLFRLKLALLELNNYWRGPQRRGGIFLYGFASQGLWAIGLPTDTTGYILQPAAMLEVLNEVAVRLEVLQPGQAYIVHLLLPHVPYVLSKDCSVNPTSVWSRPGGEQSEQEIYEHYWDQAACAHLQVMQVVNRLSNDTVVIVHGDHGARVTWKGLNGSVDADMYQTMLAVRHGKSSGRKITDRLSLPRVFSDVFAAIKDSARRLGASP